MDQCVLPAMTYGCQTSSLNKQLTNKLRTAQRAMKRKMLGLKLQDKIPCSEIRKRTKKTDIIEYTLKQKSRWARHIARMKDQTLYRMATKEKEEIKRTTMQKTARRHNKDPNTDNCNNWTETVTLINKMILQNCTPVLQRWAPIKWAFCWCTLDQCWRTQSIRATITIITIDVWCVLGRSWRIQFITATTIIIIHVWHVLDQTLKDTVYNNNNNNNSCLVCIGSNPERQFITTTIIIIHVWSALDQTLKDTVYNSNNNNSCLVCTGSNPERQFITTTIIIIHVWHALDQSWRTEFKTAK